MRASRGKYPNNMYSAQVQEADYNYKDVNVMPPIVSQSVVHGVVRPWSLSQK